MSYRLAADAVLVLHATFIVFALFGGLLAVRWHWIPLLHLPAAAWGVFVELAGRLCPLTDIENALRAAAGHAGYDGSFIEYYLIDIIYPAGLTREIQHVLAAVVLITNIAIYGWLLWRRRRKPYADG